MFSNPSKTGLLGKAKKHRFVAGAVASALLAAATAHAGLVVSNGLVGATEYDGWENLRAATLNTATLVAGFGSNEAGSGDAVLKRTGGGHYPAGSSLYSFTTNSTFELSDTSALSDVKTVVFSILTWPNGDGSTPAGSISSLPVLNLNGGSQGLAADYTGVQFVGPFVGGGFDVDTYAYTFQWDLTAHSGVTSYDVDWGQLVHTGVLAMQLESSDTFSISTAVAAVPEPSAFATCGVVGLGLLSGLSHRRRR